MPQQFNNLPNYPVPLVEQRGNTSSAWYRFFSGLFTGLAPAAEVPTVPGVSPWTYVAPVRGFLIVSGGTVSLVQFSRDGVNFYSYGVVAGPMPLNGADLIRITYTVPPTLTFVPT